MGIQFFIGGTGQGKTTMAQHLAAEAAAERGVPVVILDPEGVLQYEGAVEIRDQAPSEALVHEVWDNGEHLIYTPRGEEADPKDDDVKDLIRMVREGGNVVFLIDECADYAAAGTQSIGAMRRLCKAHRLKGVDLYFTTQAPKDIHPRIWNIRHEVYVFHQEDPGSLDYLQAQLRLSDDWKNRINSLPPYKYIKWTRKTS